MLQWVVVFVGALIEAFVFLSAPAGSVDSDGVSAVDESVEDGRGGDAVTAEVFAPALPVDVGGDDGAGAVVVAVLDHLVEEAGVLGCVPFGPRSSFREWPPARPLHDGEVGWASCRELNWRPEVGPARVFRLRTMDWEAALDAPVARFAGCDGS